MTRKLITTISLISALSMAGVASTAIAANNTTPTSPGACNMLHTNDQGLIGMMNDRHVYDIMIPLVLASLDAGCTPR
ncbi:MAG TPA: hypothetical protein VGR85_02730 [Candidatus Limnocylindria bacterium]|jgi:hypothetical protein|nr:hypothetical protein [Candidatus Limnocylindria bacterium]